MEVCCSFDSIMGKMGLFNKQNVVNYLGLMLTQYKNSRWLDMYAGLRCSLHLICVNGYPLCNILQILMLGVMRRLEIFVY